MKKSTKIVFMAVVIAYVAVIIGYFLGKLTIQSIGLEYRFWVETIFRIIVWFVPVLLIGVLLLLGCINQWKKKSGSKWVLTIILTLYGLAATYLSFIYIVQCLHYDNR